MCLTAYQISKFLHSQSPGIHFYGIFALRRWRNRWRTLKNKLGERLLNLYFKFGPCCLCFSLGRLDVPLSLTTTMFCFVLFLHLLDRIKLKWLILRLKLAFIMHSIYQFYITNQVNIFLRFAKCGMANEFIFKKITDVHAKLKDAK